MHTSKFCRTTKTGMVFLWCACCASIAWAGPNQTTGLLTSFQSATMQVNKQLVTTAMGTAAAALSLQWIASHWRELFNGEMSSLLAKSVGVISWFGFTVWLLQNQDILSTAFRAYLSLAGSFGGVPSGKFDAYSIIEDGVKAIVSMNSAVALALDSSWYQIAANFGAAIMLEIADLFAFAAYLIVAIGVFIASAEFWMMFAVAPLMFGLIPLQALREQGIAPIKHLISLGLRIIILGAIVGVMNKMTVSLATMELPKGDGMYAPIWYYLAGMLTCSFMAISAGKIASALASGSASFSGADVIKTGAQAATGLKSMGK